MGFSPEIKRNELVASARHCCVCHRYKGVRVEVHHIVPTHKGGPDDEENAIALCFDCHCDAGHYNKRHPKGTKLSFEELKKAKREWHKIVRENNIEIVDTADAFLCKYYLVKEYKQVRDICRNKLDVFSLPYPLSLNTRVTHFQKEITETKEYRGIRTFGKNYDNVEHFLKEYPDAKKIKGSNKPFEWCEYTREPCEEDIKEYIEDSDFITFVLYKSGVPLNDIVRPHFYYQEDGCGGAVYNSHFYIREVWGLYMALTNLTDNPIRICTINSVFNDPDSVNYRKYSSYYDGNEQLIEAPKALIDTKQTVVVPLATLVPKFDRMQPIEKSARYFGYGEREIVHADYSALTEDCYLIGPSIAPLSVEINSQGNRLTQGLHKFDLKNLYSLNEHLMVGSCPHIFYRYGEGRECIYEGELFMEGPGKLTKTSFNIPKEVKEIVIAELEIEETMIHRLQINNEDLLKDIKILPDQYLSIRVEENDVITVVGSYSPWHHDEKEVNKFVYHYDRIPTFINNIRRKDKLSRYTKIYPIGI